MRRAHRGPTALEAQPVPGLPALDKAYRSAGLHDLALHPDFARNRPVYFTFNRAGDFTPASGTTPARQQSRLAVMRALRRQGAGRRAGDLPGQIRWHQRVAPGVLGRWSALHTDRRGLRR
ncbi:MAG: PQQ-dependent sugar dehydrogenase [Proteobacteria bacterium]|nr:PQQ-dependent sugar dehydrogenase [Pseudomonadota bacterium]